LIDVALPPAAPAITAGATFEQHLASMFASVAGLAAGSQQWADQLSGDVFTDELVNVAPDVAIDITLAGAAAIAASGQILDAYARAGTEASYSAEANSYFAQLTQFVKALTELSVGLHETLNPLRAAPFSTQSCVMIAFFEDSESCDFDADGRQVVANIELAFVSADEPNAIDESAAPLTTGDLCDVWEQAVPGGVSTEIDLLLIESPFDERLLFRAECLQDVDAEDLASQLFAASSGAIRSVYDDVITVGAQLQFDYDFYDAEPDMTPSDYRAGEHTAMLALHTAVRDGGLREYPAIVEPLGRAALLSFALVGGLEVPYWQYLIDNDMDDADLTQLARDCIDDSSNTLESCDASVTPFARLAAFSDDYQTLIDEPIVDWEDEITDALDQCQIWADALGEADVDTQNRVTFQVAQLGLDVVLGLEDC